MYSTALRQDTPPVPSLPNYAFGERLGAGSYGTVYKARLISSIPSRPSSAMNVRPTSAAPTFYAIKCINRKLLNKATEDLLINEIKLLKTIKHDHIVEMYDFQWDDNYIYIVMEYCSGGDLSMFIRSKRQLSEEHARLFLKEIAKVLQFLHEKQISHMDLKPANILLKSTDKPILKVADFGLAQHIEKSGVQGVRGTLMYMAPEILSSHPYDNRVDLWSIGVILYECLFGRPPFDSSDIPTLIYTIRSHLPIEIPAEPRLSPECQDLLEQLLQRDPNQRITFQQFFEHPFIFDNLTSQLTHADQLFEQAMIHEHAGDLKSALDCRVQALDEYAAIMKVDEDVDRRRRLRTKIKHDVLAAEALKKRMRETAAIADLTPPVTTSPSSTPSLVFTNNADLTSDQELSAAYQHCLNGNQFMTVFAFAKAIEEYEIGLEVLLRFARAETDPSKKKILRDMISHYLTIAERCKKRLEAQRLDLAIEKIKADSEADATIVEELAHVEKKQQAPSLPHCHQQ